MQNKSYSIVEQALHEWSEAIEGKREGGREEVGGKGKKEEREKGRKKERQETN